MKTHILSTELIHHGFSEATVQFLTNKLGDITKLGYQSSPFTDLHTFYALKSDFVTTSDAFQNACWQYAEQEADDEYSNSAWLGHIEYINSKELFLDMLENSDTFATLSDFAEILWTNIAESIAA